jgi:hypothetical protein
VLRDANIAIFVRSALKAGIRYKDATKLAAHKFHVGEKSVERADTLFRDRRGAMPIIPADNYFRSGWN